MKLPCNCDIQFHSPATTSLMPSTPNTSLSLNASFVLRLRRTVAMLILRVGALGMVLIGLPPPSPVVAICSGEAIRIGVEGPSRWRSRGRLPLSSLLAVRGISRMVALSISTGESRSTSKSASSSPSELDALPVLLSSGTTLGVQRSLPVPCLREK